MMNIVLFPVCILFLSISSLSSEVLTHVPSTPSIYNDRGEWKDVTGKPSSATLPQLTSKSYLDDEALIFVGISSYRDSRCVQTIRNLFQKAKYPDRIRIGKSPLLFFNTYSSLTLSFPLSIGIIQQRHTEEDHYDCVNDFCGGGPKRPCKRRHQLRFIEYSHQDTRGPTHTRYLQQSLIEDEEFCMSVDSHSDVIKDWDVDITKMWGGIGNEYAILSQRPPDISALDPESEYAKQQRVPHLCQAAVNPQ